MAHQAVAWPIKKLLPVGIHCGIRKALGGEFGHHPEFGLSGASQGRPCPGLGIQVWTNDNSQNIQI